MNNARRGRQFLTTRFKRNVVNAIPYKLRLALNFSTALKPSSERKGDQRPLPKGERAARSVARGFLRWKEFACILLNANKKFGAAYSLSHLR